MSKIDKIRLKLSVCSAIFNRFFQRSPSGNKLVLETEINLNLFRLAFFDTRSERFPDFLIIWLLDVNSPRREDTWLPSAWRKNLLTFLSGSRSYRPKHFYGDPYSSFYKFGLYAIDYNLKNKFKFWYKDEL